MLTGRAVGSVAAVWVVLGLLLAVPTYSQPADVADGNEVVVEAPAENAADHEAPEDYIWDSSAVIPIVLDGNAITAETAGAIVEGCKVTIVSGGAYSLSGVLDDGQVIVDCKDKKIVRLILNGAHIGCSWSAPVIVENAKKTIIVLAEDTENYLADGRTAQLEDAQVNEPNAVIFSKDNLTICGAGRLTVAANVNDAISSKDGLIIAGGVIDIDAVDDGVRGKDYLVIRGGTMTIKAGGDGLKSDNRVDATKGYVSIESGVITIVSIADAIQAATDVLISGGTLALTAGGGSRNRGGVNPEAKGLKAGVSVVVEGGQITVDSYDDAVHSNGRVTVRAGALALATRDDAMSAAGALEIAGGDLSVTKSYEGLEGLTVAIDDGYVQIVSDGDAISAETDVTISGGEIILTSGGGSNAKIGATLSAKGVKAAGNVTIDGGRLTVNAADDALHADGDVTIDGGAFVLSSGDDGIRAGANLVINDGDIQIVKSYEGLESADADIVINGGLISIVSSDDGINVSAGGDMGMPGGQPGQPGQPTQPTQPTRPGRGGLGTAAIACCLYIHGGYLVVNAAGDGLDSNGSIVMTDGMVLVNGPTANNNGALDHSSFTLTGGFLLAAGSSGMAQAPSTTSTQCSILVTFNTTLPGGTLFHVRSSTGQDIVTFAPTKPYSSVAFSSDRLIEGATYDVYYGGASTGIVCDGLYENGVYTPGTQYTRFTITGTVTNVRR